METMESINNMCLFETLPDELLYMISEYLNNTDRTLCKLICRLWNERIKNWFTTTSITMCRRRQCYKVQLIACNRCKRKWYCSVTCKSKDKHRVRGKCIRKVSDLPISKDAKECIKFNPRRAIYNQITLDGYWYYQDGLSNECFPEIMMSSNHSFVLCANSVNSTIVMVLHNFYQDTITSALWTWPSWIDGYNVSKITRKHEIIHVELTYLFDFLKYCHEMFNKKEQNVNL